MAAQGNTAYFVEKLKIWSGEIVFIYVIFHLLNHALGLISIDVMEWGREVFLGFWRSWPMNYVVVSALTIHAILGIVKTLRRKSFRGLRGTEWAQIVIGLIAPAGAIGHILFTKYVHEVYGIEDTYLYYLSLGKYEGIAQGMIFTFLLWWHGVIGLRGVLATKPWFEAWRRRLLVVAYLFPVLAMAGALSGAHQILVRMEFDPTYQSSVFQQLASQGIEFEAWYVEYNALSENLAGAYLGIILLMFTVRAGVIRWRRRRNPIHIDYGDGQEIQVALGTSLLEASHMARIPHAHVCGGRGRCSTCRVRVYEGADQLPPPSLTEQRILRRIGAADNVRLACQTQPEASCRVMPLLPAETQLPNFADSRFLHGMDRKIAVLFADLRGFTAFSEHKLPFDVVFVLNQYFQAVGKAIELRGGYLDKFIGDGAMALFGIDTDIRTACKQAIDAAWEMGQELERLNARLSAELPQPLKIGIGLHCGDTIVGKMGYKHTNHLTAIGDAVNTASRLESMTKEYGAQLMISEDVAGNAEVELDKFDSVEVSIRGKSNSMYAFVVPQVRDLPKPEAITPRQLRKVVGR